MQLCTASVFRTLTTWMGAVGVDELLDGTLDMPEVKPYLWWEFQDESAYALPSPTIERQLEESAAVSTHQCVPTPSSECQVV